MGLAIRIIPVLLQRGPSLVKGVKFGSWRSVGHVRQAFKIYQAREVDELIYLNIAATPAGMAPDYQLVEELTKDCFMPLTVGGGVKNQTEVRRLFNSGADKVSVCTALFENPKDIEELIKETGSQAIVASIDVRNNEVFTHCGTRPRNVDPVGFAEHCENIGVGEILLTSIEKEGTLKGYDLDLIHRVSKAVSIPVIANGGCGDYLDMIEAIDAGASAVAASAFFQWSDATPKGAANYLHANGISVRL